MKRYILTSPLISGQISLIYQADGQLIEAKIDAVLSQQQIVWLSKNFPSHESYLTQIKSDTLRITEAPLEVTFEAFYIAYRYKVDKKRAEDVWKRMKPADQLAAYLYVPKYLQHLQLNGTAPMYPKTYLASYIWTS